MSIWRRNTSITCTYACSNSGMRLPSKVVALLLVAACPNRDTNPSEAVALDSRAPRERPRSVIPADARVAQDAEAAPDAAARWAACDGGANCAALGKQAFDERRYLDTTSTFRARVRALLRAWLQMARARSEGCHGLRIPVDATRVAPTLAKACELGELQKARWMLGNGYLYGGRSVW